jgi:AcrR family transcriptional regulator
MPAKGGRYHHGDLRSALVDAAIAVIAERGVRGFSLAEATRRLGVTTAAPYRHFAARQRPLFDTIFNSGLDKSRYPELQRAWERVDALLAVVLRVCDGDTAATHCGPRRRQLRTFTHSAAGNYAPSRALI